MEQTTEFNPKPGNTSTPFETKAASFLNTPNLDAAFDKIRNDFSNLRFFKNYKGRKNGFYCLLTLEMSHKYTQF